MSEGPGIIMRIAAGVVALLFFAITPVLFICAEGWWRKLGAIPGIGFGVVFALYAIRGRKVRA
jgi:hypothetical protein